MPETGGADESARIERLRSLAILDTEPEAIFDQCTRLAADLCAVPIALISLIDTDRQWFKSNIGLQDSAETSRDLAFCAKACQSDELLEVHDATRDARFADNPLVTGEPGIRFYAGAPIMMPGGERIGALCVIDRVARELTEMQRTALIGLSRMVASALLEREHRLRLVGELARAEANYRTIVEGQSELISLADEEGTLTYVNPAYAQFFGRRREEMIGRKLLDLVADHDREAVRAHLRRVAELGIVASDANRMLSADGEQRWVAWTNRTVDSQAGRSRAIHSVGRDITEQRRAEQALAEAESRNRLLYESTPAMLHSIDSTGRLLNVSQTWLDTLGYERQEVIGRASVDFLTAESRQRARESVIPAFFEHGRSDDIEYRMVRKNGSIIDVLVSAVLERDASGRPVRSLAVTRDVTESKANAAALSNIRHMLQLVLDSLPARISYWDGERRCRFANRAFLADFDLTEEAVTGRHVQQVIGDTWYGRIRSHIEEGLAGRDCQLETSSVARDGQRRDLDLRFTPDLREGQVRGLFVFALDVTARRQAERGLAERDRRFKLLIDGVRDYAIYMLDARGMIATWNAGAERHKGYRAEEVIGQHFRRFFLPEDVAAGLPDAELAIAARDGRFEAEGWRLRADGSRFWAGVLLSPLRDDQGELVGYAKITRDLTEQRRQQLMLDRVVELAPCAMLMIDAAGLILMVNAQAESTFGYSRAELLGHPLEMLIPPRWRGQHPSLREGFRARGTAMRVMGAGRDLRALRRNGEEFPVEVGLSPIDSARGPATLAAIFDITERRQQQAATEQALAEKETLLREVYHRVKNNLQVVQSLLSLQSQTLPDGAARGAIDDSVQRVRAMALVHEKLYQSGNLAAVSLPDYVRDLVEQIAEAHGTDRRMVKLHVDIPEMQSGLDSAVPFGLLLTELITNCLKHAFPQRRSGDVRVSLVRQADGDLLTIADNGVGFPAGFDAAARTGSMGLQLAEGLARQLGGELRFGVEAGSVVDAVLTRLRLK